MRIVSWNCRQALRNKTGYLTSLDADLAVVPESENLERLAQADLDAYPNRIWEGDVAYKGLLVMARDGRSLQVAPEFDPWLKLIVPVLVGGPQPLTVVAVWAQKDDGGNYSADLMTALDRYEGLLGERAVVIGDFNSNAVWDERWAGSVTHSAIVARMGALGLTSLYHASTGEQQGTETVQTLAFKGDPAKPYHVDHCFASRDLVDAGATLRIPPVADWIAFSDHGPLVVDIP